MFTAPADVMGTDIGTDNTGSVAETVRNDALGVFFRLLVGGLLSSLAVAQEPHPRAGVNALPVQL